jgi:hypothetical protein
LAAIDPDLPLSDIQTMGQRTSASVVPQKLAMGLASTFGVVALFLSTLGIYGVLAYVVAQRTREIGIRIALGSTTRDIFQLVFKEGLTLVAVGLMLGCDRIEHRVAVVRLVAELRGRRHQREPGRLAYRKRPQHETIDEGEDRGVRADAEAEGQDGDDRDDWRGTQRSDGEPEILTHAFTGPDERA